MFIKGPERRLNKWEVYIMSWLGTVFIVTLLNLTKLIWKINTTSKEVTT